MNIKVKGRNKSILDFITVIKFSILGFVFLITVGNIPPEQLEKPLVVSRNTYILIGLLIFLALVIYGLWAYLYVNKRNNTGRVITQTIENYIYVLFLTLLIISTNSYDSQFKFLFAFAIISATLGLGKKQGYILSIVSAIIMLSIDLLFVSHKIINIYFENDLAMATMFIIIAGVLGQYVQGEKNRIQELEMGLEAQLSEHNVVKEMLKRNDQLSKLLIENSPDAIFIHTNNKIVYVNESALELLGLSSRKQIMDKCIVDFELSDDEDSLDKKYLDVFTNQEKSISFEDTIKNINGKIVKVRNTSTYCIYEDRPAILTILRDMEPVSQAHKLRNDVKKNIELLNETMEYNKYITEFFSNISHELKTPLNVIFSSLQLLLLYNDNSEKEIIKKKEAYMISAKQNCYRLLRLINNILDMTKVDAGYITPHMRNQNIVSAVEDITMSILSYTESKGVQIIFDTDIEELIIAFDEEKVERIMLNLLSNALKFTNKGGSIYVTITENEEYALISVKDTGIGIPEDKKEVIFERFGQVDKSFRRNAEGTGIGLSLVQSFVKLHGGKIELNSKLGEGSEFVVYIPLTQIKEEEHEETQIKSNISERVNMELSDIQ